MFTPLLHAVHFSLVHVISGYELGISNRKSSALTTVPQSQRE